MTRRNTLNNMQLGNIRKTQGYQAVITDLAIEGVVPLEAAERLLGYSIPDALKTPGGGHVSRKAAQKDAAKAEDAQPRLDGMPPDKGRRGK